MSKLPGHLGELIAVFVPGGLGALVALAHMPGLTWKQRFIAAVSGCLTASFIGWALQDLMHLSTPVSSGLSFLFGLVAFSATPALQHGVAGGLEGLPGYLGGWASAIADRIRTFGGPKS